MNPLESIVPEKFALYTGDTEKLSLAFGVKPLVTSNGKFSGCVLPEEGCAPAFILKSDEALPYNYHVEYHCLSAPSPDGGETAKLVSRVVELVQKACQANGEAWFKTVNPTVCVHSGVRETPAGRALTLKSTKQDAPRFFDMHGIERDETLHVKGAKCELLVGLSCIFIRGNEVWPQWKLLAVQQLEKPTAAARSTSSFTVVA